MITIFRIQRTLLLQDWLKTWLICSWLSLQVVWVDLSITVFQGWLYTVTWLTWLTALRSSWPARRFPAPGLTLYLDSPDWPYWVWVDQPGAVMFQSWLYILAHLIDRIEFELTSPALGCSRVDSISWLTWLTVLSLSWPAQHPAVPGLTTHLIGRIEFELTSPALCCSRVDSISWLTWLTVLSLSWPAHRFAAPELTLYILTHLIDRIEF